MEILKNIKVPTGNIMIVGGNKGKLECLSIGDYGRDANVKAQFLGLNKDIQGVPNGKCMPLEEKWVVTISTQYGCNSACKFCLLEDAPILMEDYTYKKIKDVELGNRVICNLNPKENINSPIKQYATKRTTVGTVTGLVQRQYNGKMYKVKTEDGHSIICTENHPIAKKYKSRYLFDKANNISIGDILLVGKHYHDENLYNKNWMLGWAYGMILSDGVYDEIDCKRWMISQNELSDLKFCMSILANNGIATSNYWKNGENNYRFAIQGSQVDLFNNLILNTKKDNFYKKGFIAGFWDGDGYSFNNNEQLRICNTTISYIELFTSYIEDLGYTLNSLRKTKKAKNHHKECFIANYKINRDTFISEFTPINKKKLFLNNSNSLNFCYEDKVISVDSYDYNGIVYNFETTEHSYYAYDVLTHNCDVPKVGKGINATYDDIKGQIETALSLHPEVTGTKRLNIHYARMGEPSWNPDVLKVTYDLHKITKQFIGNSMIHPVFTTMCPNKNRNLIPMLQEWTNDIKNDKFRGDAGLQLSINSTNDEQRYDMFSGNALSLKEISDIVRDLPMPVGRKYALNFALADNYEVNAQKLRELFSPEKCMVKITPLHDTYSCEENHIQTSGGYTSFVPYQKAESELINVGFDVLVFVPSMDEDEGRITCGNAILSGSMPKCDYK